MNFVAIRSFRLVKKSKKRIFLIKKRYLILSFFSAFFVKNFVKYTFCRTLSNILYYFSFYYKK